MVLKVVDKASFFCFPKVITHFEGLMELRAYVIVLLSLVPFIVMRKKKINKKERKKIESLIFSLCQRRKSSDNYKEEDKYD